MQGQRLPGVLRDRLEQLRLVPALRALHRDLGAAQLAWPKQGQARRAVLDALRDEPRTRDELAAATGLSPNTIRPRVAELVAGGWVEVKTDSEGDEVTRKTAAGRQSAVLCLTFSALRELRSEDH